MAFMCYIFYLITRAISFASLGYSLAMTIVFFSLGKYLDYAIVGYIIAFMAYMFSDAFKSAYEDS